MCCLRARAQKCLPRSLLQPFIVYCLAPCPRITRLRALQLRNIAIVRIVDARD